MANRLEISTSLSNQWELYELPKPMLIPRLTMKFARLFLCFTLLVVSLTGCGDNKTVIPNAPFTEEQKKAIKAEDSKVADEESHGAKKR